jgi:formylglycine-generating enzyme required for sulfatase activity
MDKSFGDQDTISPGSKVGGHAYALKAGDLFGQYRVIRVLGAGGMGEVYEVEHKVLRRRYAIKLLPESLDWKGVSVERFEREAQVMANLDHPNILKVDEFGEVNGRYWLRMEVAEGVECSAFRLRQGYGGQVGVQCSGGEKAVSLQNLAEAYGGKIPQEELLPLLRQVLEGLQYAHAHGAIHRDLKPSNILLSSPNTEHRTPNTPLAKISDFGLVRLVGEDWVRSQAQLSVQRSMSMGDQLTAGGTPSVASEGTSTRALLGTYEYMSPEQKRGEEADERSDLYAVGLMAYRLLTGRSLGMKTPSQIDKSLVPGWDTFVEQALEEDPAERLASASSALTLLNAISQELESDEHEAEAKRKQEEEARKLAEQARLEEQRRKQAAEEARKQRQAEEAAERQRREQEEPAPPWPATEEKAVAAHLGCRKRLLWLLLIAAAIWGYFVFTVMEEAPTPQTRATETEPVRQPAVAPVPARPVTQTEARRAEPRLGDTQRVDLGGGVHLELVWIPATTSDDWKRISGGKTTFTMGSPDNESGRWDGEGPQHQVTISRGFWMGKYPVTQRQYQQLMGENPSSYTQAGPNAPVERVTWHMATNFNARLQQRLSGDLQGKSAGLPTEAEWEYACRAGTTAALYTGKELTSTGGRCRNLDEIAWYGQNSGGSTKAVGEKQANSWGLHDLLGNVWEWCQDGRRTYSSSAVTDPGINDTLESSSRVLRGGSWFNFAGCCRSARRLDVDPGFQNINIGFRVVVR